MFCPRPSHIKNRSILVVLPRNKQRTVNPLAGLCDLWPYPHINRLHWHLACITIITSGSNNCIDHRANYYKLNLLPNELIMTDCHRSYVISQSQIETMRRRDKLAYEYGNVYRDQVLQTTCIVFYLYLMTFILLQIVVQLACTALNEEKQ